MTSLEISLFPLFLFSHFKIMKDPSEKDDLPDVIDDFELDFNAGSHEVSARSLFSCTLSLDIFLRSKLQIIDQKWLQHVAKEENLKKFTEKTVVHIMNEPREGKPLLVLDLDHTLLDFSSKALTRDATLGDRASIANAMKR